MKTITLDIKDEYYEEFMAMLQEYIDKGLVKIVSSSNEATDNT
jgi:hypothetical protein